MKLREIKLTPPIVAISAMLLAFTGTAATRHRYYWANLLGSNVFNDMGNWVDETFSASGNPYYYFPSSASGETVTMGADFTAYLFYFTNEVDVGTTTLDFNGRLFALTGRLPDYREELIQEK